MRYILFLALLLSVTPSLAREKDTKDGKSSSHLASFSAINPAETIINVNNITSWVRGNGYHINVVGGSWNGTFPKGTAGFVFAEAIVWGGMVNDGQNPVLRVNGQLFAEGFRAGKILTDASGKVIGREVDNPATARPYRVRPDWKTADLRNDAATFNSKSTRVKDDQVTQSQIDDIRAQYETDSTQWPWQKGAPFDDRNGNGIYDAGDIPGIPGADQTIWIVYNDLDPQRAANVFGSPPIGLEVQETYWAYATSNPLANIIFKRVRFIYKGTTLTPANATIDSMYVVQWADPDLGEVADDLVGCDTTLSLGFAYNSKTTDDVYFKSFGLPPPAGGYDFLQGPIVPGASTDSALFEGKVKRGFKNLPMTAFTFFTGAAAVRNDPNYAVQCGYCGTPQWYNLMAGFEPRPEYPARRPLLDHLGRVTKFELAGDPVTGTGDVDGKPTPLNPARFPAGDRRLVMSSGPFSMARGDTQEVVVALVGGLGKDYLSSVSVLKYNAGFAQFAYKNLFVLPSSPTQPKVNVSELDKEIVLEWGSDLTNVRQTEDVVQAGFAFEGYNIYQLPSATARLQDGIRIATFDVKNLTSVIIDKVLDEQSGFVVEKPVQFGSNSGVQRYIRVTRDNVRNQPLVNGQTYYFMVTAYSFNPDLPREAPFRVLESAPIVLTATPQSVKPGVRYAKNFGDTLTVAHVSGIGTGTVKAFVVDPSKLAGDTYKLTFTGSATNKTYGARNETKGQTVYSGWTNLGELFGGTANDYPLVDGMLITVKDVPSGTKANWVGGAQWLIGFRFRTPGGTVDPISGFEGGVLPGAYGSNYLAQYGPVFNPDSSYPIEIRFSTTATQKAYRLRRKPGGGPYVVQATNPFVAVPFTVWDVTDPQSPRQLTAAWRDNNDNSTWDPPVGDDGLELIFIYNKTYNPNSGQFTSVDNNATVGVNADIVYVCSFQVLEGHTLSESDGKIIVGFNFPFDSRDVFTFKSPAKVVSAELAKADVEKINVFPNPYYGFNTRELSRLDKYVTFNHLPGKAIIRIFNLAGVLLKVIEKDDPTQFARWNLRNENNLIVASGVYIAHIDMPELGATRILKLALVQEDQILRVY